MYVFHYVLCIMLAYDDQKSKWLFTKGFYLKEIRTKYFYLRPFNIGRYKLSAVAASLVVGI